MRCKARTPFIFRCFKRAIENSPYCFQHQNYPPSDWRYGLLMLSRVVTGIVGAVGALIGFACLRNCLNRDFKAGEKQLNAQKSFDYAVLCLAVYEAKKELQIRSEASDVRIFMTPEGNGDVYFSERTESPDWRHLSAGSRQGQLPDQLKDAKFEDGDTGFRAMLYQSKDTRAIVIVYRGVKPTNIIQNSKTCACQGLGFGAAAYQQAIKLAKAVVEVYGDKVTFTGHSMGGGMAAAAAIATNRPAVTFNGAGLHPYTLEGISLDSVTIGERLTAIENYYVPGEWLSTLQRPRFVKSAAGIHVPLPDVRARVTVKAVPPTNKVRSKHSIISAVAILCDMVQRA